MNMAIGRFLAGIGCLIWNPADDTYLILRRAPTKDFAAGMWECVTGRVDQGEGFEDALRREVREELGAEVKPLFMVGTTHFYRGQDRPEYELVGIVYCGVVDRPADIRLSAEHSECRWVTATQARELLSLTQPTELWLARIIDRVEFFRKYYPDELLDFNAQQGFEMG
jgi:8-oxo-dGTP pyrophosphatase MutT (NUDIX family)